MTDSPWQLELAHFGATVTLNQLTARISLDAPHLGWHELSMAGEEVRCSPGQITLGSHDGTAATPPASMHVRGTDLIATYLPTAGRPFSAQIYRQVKLLPVGSTELVVIGSMISLHTHLLDAHPTITLRTTFSREAETIATGSAGFANPAGTGPAEALLVRPTHGSWSYLEAWHAIDYQPPHHTPGTCEHVFQEWAEKGVIRRMVVWGVLLPRSDDLVLAEAARQEFLATAPPLTT